MVVQIKVRTNFRREAVKRAVDKANFNSLGRAGAFVRQVMRRSIRKRKRGGKPSAPGAPPKTAAPDFAFRNAILFELSPQKDDVAIGPTFGGFGKVGKIHEEGGTVIAKQRTFEENAQGEVTRVTTKKVRKKYPRRPFAVPALDKARPRLPRLWANSVKS